VSATSPQTRAGTIYEFSSWSDGGAQTHNLVASAAPTTYTATYVIAPPRNIELPRISGQPRQGRQLTVSDGTWSGSLPMTFAYQWRRCDSSGNECVDIAGATARTYTPTSADVGLRMRATARATNAGGSASATSTPTATVKR
jgi:hypothetical protein